MAFAQAEEVIQHPILDESGGLRHPDPLGEAGRLDRCGQGHQIAVPLGQGRIHRHQAVAIGADFTRDLRGPDVRDRARWADDDGTRIELQDTGAPSTRRESMGEAGITGPQQVLVTRSVGAWKQAHVIPKAKCEAHRTRDPRRFDE